MPSVTDMFAGASLSGTDPFNPSSIFKDPSAAGCSQLNDIHSNLSMLALTPGLDGGISSQINSMLPTLSGFGSLIQTNTMDRVKNIHGDLQSVLAVKNIRSTVSAADGGEHDMDCGMVNDIFGSVANIGAMITDTITQMQNALSDVLSTIGDIFTAGMTAISGAVLSAINAASAAISSALSTVGSLISDAMTGLQDMINTEKEKLAALMNEMLGFGFLKSLPSLDICGQDLMSGILDSSKISTGVLGSL